MVILIKLSCKASLNLHLEQWRIIKDESKSETRTQKAKIPGRVLYWDIKTARKVTHYEKHPNLIIPYCTLFELGYSNSTNIVIST